MKLSNRIRNWIVDRLEQAEMAISPFQIEETSEDELNAMSKRAITSTLARVHYPCKTCKAKGVIKNADGDYVGCCVCVGTGIDIERAREGMRL